MITSKLYPPILAGTTPPFYKNAKGTYDIEVPFSLNKMVVPNEIGGVKLRIRDADTDIELARINAKEITITTNNCKAVFDVTNIKGIIIGKYYKI